MRHLEGHSCGRCARPGGGWRRRAAESNRRTVFAQRPGSLPAHKRLLVRAGRGVRGQASCGRAAPASSGRSGGRSRDAFQYSRGEGVSERSERAYRGVRHSYQSHIINHTRKRRILQSRLVSSFRFPDGGRYVLKSIRRPSVGDRDRGECIILCRRVILPFLPLTHPPFIPRVTSITYSLRCGVAWHVGNTRLRCPHHYSWGSAEACRGPPWAIAWRCIIYQSSHLIL